MSPLMKKLTTDSRKPLPKESDKDDSQTDIVIFDSKSVVNYDPYQDPKILALYFQVLKLSTTYFRPVLYSEDYISLIMNKKYYLLISPSRNLKQECCTLEEFNEDQYIEVLRRSEVRRGNFYFIGMGYPVLNNFLLMRRWSTITCNLLKDAAFANSLRWAYINSNLHRRVIFNSHKLTESKKLISAGYLDSSSTRTNLWFSDKYSRDWIIPKARKSSRIKTSRVLNILDLLGVQSRLLYKKPHNPTPNTLNLLSFYEPSFHHLLGRCQYYSSLWAMRYFTNPRYHYYTEGVFSLSPLLLYSTALTFPNSTSQGLNPRDLYYNYFSGKDNRNLLAQQTPVYPLRVRNDLVINRPRKSLNGEKKGHIIIVTKPISAAEASLYTPVVVPTFDSQKGNLL